MNTSNKSHRIVVLDTETTGMNREGGPTYLNHRIIEIGAVEIIDVSLRVVTFTSTLSLIVRSNPMRLRSTVLPMSFC